MATKPRKKPKPQPRQAKGKFSTSKAKKKRIKNGIDIKSKTAIPSNRISGYASQLAQQAPLMTSETRQAISELIVKEKVAFKPTVALFQSQEQKLVAALRARLIESAPSSARYLSDLVNGEHEAAPHSVRAQAALGIIDRAIQITQANPEAKDQAEMSLEELQRLGSQIHHQLASANAEDAEIVPEVGNAAPLRPETSLD